MKQVILLSLVLSLSPFGIVPAHAAGMDMQGIMDMQDTNKTPANAVIHAVGVVKEVKQAKGMVVITHEPIQSLGWSAMTMDFTVGDKALFSKLTQGKKVQFDFVMRGDEYVITAVK